VEQDKGVIVSVVIATYNRASFLSRAIRSALSQTLNNIEVIVVDDASTDNTRKVVEGFEDRRIRYLYHERNIGAGAARNTGIQAAQAEFVAFLDSDDEWLPEKCEKQVALFRNSPEKVGLIYCGHISFLETTQEVRAERMPTVRGDVRQAALRYCVTGGGSTYMIRRRCFQKAGFFDEDMPSLEDWELLMRLSEFYEFEFIPEILTRRSIHGEQITTTLHGKIEAREGILRKHYGVLSQYPSILADHLNRLGVLHGLRGDFKQARDYLFRSLKARPLQGLAYLHLLPLSFFPALYAEHLKKEVVLKAWDGIPIYW
jgi:glycosyltransferase involved in cell wall biosynthesis